MRTDRKTYGLRPRIRLLVQHKLTFDLTGKITVVFLKISVTIPYSNLGEQKRLTKCTFGRKVFYIFFSVLTVLSKFFVEARWLVRSTLRALAGDIVLCFWERNITLSVPLSTEAYKWVPANLMPGEPCHGLASHPGGE